MTRKYFGIAALLILLVAGYFVGGEKLLGSFEELPFGSRFKQNTQPVTEKNPIRSLVNQDDVPRFINPYATDVVALYKEGPKNYTYTPQQIANISYDKKTLLSQFSICATGKKDATITGIKVKMYSKAQYSFIPYLDSKQLWKTEITDMMTPPNSPWNDSSWDYDTKTYDFLLDTPTTILLGKCKKLNLMATKIIPGGKWILPVIVGVGTNEKVEFIGDGNAKKVFDGKDPSKEYGLGVLSLLYPQPGPLVIENYVPSLKSITSPDYEYFNFFGHHTYANPQKISSITLEMKTNSTQKFDASLDMSVNGNDPLDGSNTPGIQAMSQKITLEPNKPQKIPVDLTLPSFSGLSIIVHGMLPAGSATYSVKLSGIVSDGAVILENNDVTKFAPFVSKKSGTVEVNIPGMAQPAFPPDYTDDPPPDDYSDGDALVKETAAVHGLKFWGMENDQTYSAESATNKILKDGSLEIGYFAVDNLDKKNSSVEYVASPLNFTLKTNMTDSPLKVRIDTESLDQPTVSKEIIIIPNTPTTLNLPKFTNELYVHIQLIEFPKTIKQNFYIQTVFNSLSFTYGKEFTVMKNGISKKIAAGSPVSVISYNQWGKTSKMINFPKGMGSTIINFSGLFQTSSDNIGPPYTKVVDLDSLDPKAFIEMSQFCLLANENTDIKELNFEHVVRETSPFSTIKLSVNGNLDILLEKSGWTKKDANFPMSSPINFVGGETKCFSLKVQGVIDDSLEGIYFDLMNIKAFSSKGVAMKTILKNGEALSPDNILKGTQFDFF